MKATLSLTHRCNLACRYCYSGRSMKPDMSPEIAIKSVDFVLGLSGKDNHINFGFFGGEPLLRFDLIRHIVPYIRQKALEAGKDVSFSITTNGTILTTEITDFFREENFDVCVSLDGPQPVHDKNRVFHNGRGSYSKVINHLKIAQEQLGQIQVNSVYSPETVPDLPENLELFLDLDLPVIHFNPNIQATWTEDALKFIKPAFLKIAERYIECYESGRELAVNFIDSKLILFLKNGYSQLDICGMGKSEWGIAPSGNIYACERLIGEDEGSVFCLGNIDTGLDPARHCKISARQFNRNLACRDCDLRKFCMNWCGCSNYYQTGSIDVAGLMICAIEHAAINAAQQVFITLNEQKNELFLDHLWHYADCGQKFRLI